MKFSTFLASLRKKIEHFFFSFSKTSPKSFREKLPDCARSDFDEIVKLASRQKYENQNKFSITPLENIRWIAQFENIDAFLICGVSLPTVFLSEKRGKEEVAYGNMYVTFYEPEKNSCLFQLVHLLDGKKKKLCIRWNGLDRSELQKWELDVKLVKIHPTTRMDYENYDVLKWQVEMECFDWREVTDSSGKRKSKK